MKALSLWQPWASTVATGAKQIETRGWRTHYRGPLLIHAAKSVQGQSDEALCALLHMPRFRDLPFGALVAVCRLVDCIPTGHFRADRIYFEWQRNPNGEGRQPWHGRRLAPIPAPGDPGPQQANRWSESRLGNFGPGRYGWVLSDIQRLPEPIPCRGRQGLFEVPDSVIEGST